MSHGTTLISVPNEFVRYKPSSRVHVPARLGIDVEVHCPLEFERDVERTSRSSLSKEGEKQVWRKMGERGWEGDVVNLLACMRDGWEGNGG